MAFLRPELGFTEAKNFEVLETRHDGGNGTDVCSS